MNSLAHFYLYLASILFCLGILGICLKRNALTILMCVELMLNASNLAMVGVGASRGDLNPQIFSFMIMVIAAAEAAVGLALVIALFRTHKSVDISLVGGVRK